jgi:hypothetical protein
MNTTSKEDYYEYYSYLEGAVMMSYEFTTSDGRKFCTIGFNIDECRRRKDNWLTEEKK